MQQEPDWKNFVDSVRRCLNHLYDPGYLRKSPLVFIFGLESKRDAVFKLQELIANAIQQTNEASSGNTTPLSPDIHRILTNRYYLQVPQVELASQLGMSERQLRREQNFAIEFLASQLWNKYILPKGKEEVFSESHPDIDQQAITDAAARDLDWLKSSEEEGICNPNQILISVVDMIEPLLSQNHANLDLSIEGPLPLICVHGLVLQQVLLSILSQAVHQSHGCLVSLESQQIGNWVELIISYSISDNQPSQSPDAVLSLTRQMLQMFSAEICFHTQEEKQIFTVSLPVLHLARVLMIDDNPDFISLMQRFTTGSRYEIYGFKGNDNLFDHIIATHPAAIILDIMMPKVDGWELLKIIRSNTHTSSIPIIICTILPQENLAAALGAHDFLKKPVTQDSLLKILTRWVPLQA